MRERLPIDIENLELPKDDMKIDNKHSSYGFANILYLLSLIITFLSVITVIILGNR